MICRLGNIENPTADVHGGKAIVLDRLIKSGLPVPPGIILSTSLYSSYIKETGIEDFLSLNIVEQKIEKMRWEEIWDLAQRIKLRFLRTPIPPEICRNILDELSIIGERSVVVRSSSPTEDSSLTSFAGLHDSLVDISGTDNILDAVREVWSSLWSDRALVYSREMDLRPEQAAMAVIIQELIIGEDSGVLFTRRPGDSKQMLIETVSGLNEKLVSGAAEPDRYTLSRSDGSLVEFHPSADIPEKKPDLRCELLYKTGLKLEQMFEKPQDIEWTLKSGKLFILQSRPITTIEAENKPLWEQEDKRAWYRSLRKSLKELEELKLEIESGFMTELDEISRRLSQTALEELSDDELDTEIDERKKITEQWKKAYWEICIPFAHGVRTFGEIYNRVIKPESPFEFVELLVNQNLKSVERNRKLELLARTLNDNKNNPDSPEFRTEFDKFLNEYGQSSFFDGLLFEDKDQFVDFLKVFRTDNIESGKQESTKALERLFLAGMEASGREDGQLLLDLGRISYKLRDDDNIQLGKLQGELYRAESELRLRKPPVSGPFADKYWPEEIAGFRISHRQVTGACASPGFASGKARVLSNREDLFKTREGEIIVCDSIDPNITFVIPLAAGIVERRGGMLVHGAIIAREYKIPCITGVEDAVRIIKNGDFITVDAYNGIVVIDESPDN